MGALPQLLAEHRFVELFRDELGWDGSSSSVMVDVENRHFEFQAVAQKRGFQVFQCGADRRVLFNRGLLRRIQRLVSRTFHEHILIYSCSNPPKQVWQWAVRLADGRRLRHREHPFLSGSPPACLESRLKGLCFSLDEEADVTFVDALHRVREALDVSPALNLFAKRPWYAERSDELAVAMARGDKDAFDAFILLHRPLARHLSKRLQRGYGLDAEDAEQIAIIGLIEAARRFNPERGTQFSTYATYWIRQACQKYGPTAALFIRLPAHVVESFLPLHRQLEKLATGNGRGCANDELARLSAEDPRFFRQWLAVERALNVRSLTDRGEAEYHESRAIPEMIDDQSIQQETEKERGERIRAAMAFLNERERRFLRLRYGMEGDPLTLEEIGQQEGITRERVRQIQLVAERKLRRVVERELRDLIPVPVVSERDVQPGAQEGILDGSEFGAPSLAGQASNGAFASPSVMVLPQEQPQLASLDLEHGRETTEQRVFQIIP
jgi:RNA polymerase sigma factor (sigma-70 family)